ncbi:hypothetical protein WJX81_001361 [Elliptochloris bilobata]|uniref:Cyclin N-terminal domain-containing protein n=1 Tax=Elliptochloris bilobata TaxID=381761 RepID=A0AAW1QUI2_9CHLO
MRAFPVFSRDWLLTSSPSRRDGISLDQEKLCRRLYCALVDEAGKQLKLSMLCIATATVFCHRFYALRSLARNDRLAVSAACLLLGAKAEEAPKPLRDVVRAVLCVRYKKAQGELDAVLAELDAVCAAVARAERALLYVLGFELNVMHPFKPLQSVLEAQRLARNAPFHAPTGTSMVPQTAWNFLVCSLHTQLCLQYSADQIATAALFLAFEELKMPQLLVGGREWWSIGDSTHPALSCEQLLDICSQILEASAA